MRNGHVVSIMAFPVHLPDILILNGNNGEIGYFSTGRDLIEFSCCYHGYIQHCNLPTHRSA